MIGELRILIKNNLAVLMAKKQRRVNELANETNLSRHTITTTAQNDGKMIQLNTINKLCQALEVTPGDFFEYEPERGR
jgi:DNA-binding Xre family transcriptional regulator